MPATTMLLLNLIWMWLCPNLALVLLAAGKELIPASSSDRGSGKLITIVDHAA